MAGPRSWEENFRLLADYQKQHGDCLVPEKYEPDRKLGRWVRAQRNRRDSRSSWQLKKLDSIGFSWNAKAHHSDKRWREQFKRLKRYKLFNGNCNVPSGYKEDPTLATWVLQQRKLLHQNILAKHRIDMLNKVGFTWRLHAFNGKDGSVDDEKWLLQYNKLRQFKQTYGHCIVPAKYAADAPRSLGQWVVQQRSNFVLNRLKEDRKQLLEEIGFCWKVTTEVERKARQLVLDDMEAFAKEIRAESSQHKIGTKVRKNFNNGWFNGVATRKGPDDTWHVEYTDGEEDDIPEEELDMLAELYQEQYASPSIAASTCAGDPMNYPPLTEDQLHVGTKVRKEFDSGWLDGVVTRKGKQALWRVQYSDDSKEFVSEEELQDLVAIYEEHYSINEDLNNDCDDNEDGMVTERKQASADTFLRSPTSESSSLSASQLALSVDNYLESEAPSTARRSPNYTEEDEEFLLKKEDDENGINEKKETPMPELATSSVVKQDPPNSMVGSSQVEIVNEPERRSTGGSHASTTSGQGKAAVNTLLAQANDSGVRCGESSFIDTHDVGDGADAYAKLSPLFFKLCETINASQTGRKRLPKYEQILTKWISKEQEKSSSSSHLSKRRKLS